MGDAAPDTWTERLKAARLLVHEILLVGFMIWQVISGARESSFEDWSTKYETGLAAKVVPQGAQP